MDPVSLVLNALASGAAQGVADSVSDAVKSAYSKLKHLVTAKFGGNESAELVLSEHASDAETWQVPLAKALAVSGASADPAVIDAAQALMALLDPVGSAAGAYRVDLRGAQGVQVGEGNRQYNTFSTTVTPSIVVTPPTAEVRPGQPREEASFGPVYEAAGGRVRLGRALDEVHEESLGWVQHFDGGNSGTPALICARYGHEPVAVSQAVWNALGLYGRGTQVSGTTAVGFPVVDPAGQRSFIDADGRPVELDGGSWGRGRLVPAASGGSRWQPEVAYDSEAVRDQDVWSFRRGEMDLRLRLAARIPLVSEGLRVTAAGRTRMLDELPSTGLIDEVTALARRYRLESGQRTWLETPEPEGHNNSRFAAYLLAVPGVNSRPALIGSLWFMLPGALASDVSSVVDLGIDFEAIQPRIEQVTPAVIAPELRVTPTELVGFFTSAWQAATTLVSLTGQSLADVLPLGAPRLELYIQNRHPESSGGGRIVRTLDMVDLSVFGETRKSQLGDLSVGVKAPLILTADEIRSLVRQGLVRMAEDFGFTAADTAVI